MRTATRVKVAMIGQKGAPASYGGVERHVEELSAALAARGHEVTVFSRAGYGAAAGWHRGFRVRMLPSLGAGGLDTATHSFMAGALAAAGDFDVAHYHGVGPAAMQWLPFLAGKRRVVTVHAFDWLRLKWGPLARTALRAGAASARLADAVIAVSRHLQGELRRVYGLRAVYAPNGVAPVERAPLAELRRWGLRARGYVLFMGRLVPEKGCDLLIEAFRASTLWGGEMRLVIAGEPGGACLERLKQLAGGDSRIVFTGGLYGRERAEALTNAAAFALPSYLEGMSIGLLEALAAGCPALASDIAGNREVIAECAPAARAFRPGSADDLRRALEGIVASPPLRAELEAVAGEVARRHDWGAIAATTEAVYLRALGRRFNGLPANRQAGPASRRSSRL